MKTFGFICIALGFVISLLAVVNIDYIGVMRTISNVGLGFVCAAAGVICIATSSLLQRLSTIETVISKVSKTTDNRRPLTAEQIVEQLQQEGVIAANTDDISDKQIETFLG